MDNELKSTTQEACLDFRKAFINLLKAMGIEKLVIKLNNLLKEIKSRRLQKRIFSAAKELQEESKKRNT